MRNNCNVISFLFIITLSICLYVLIYFIPKKYNLEFYTNYSDVVISNKIKIISNNIDNINKSIDNINERINTSNIQANTIQKTLDENQQTFYDNLEKVSGELNIMKNYEKPIKKMCDNRDELGVSIESLDECTKKCNENDNCISFLHGKKDNINNICILSTTCNNNNFRDLKDNEEFNYYFKKTGKEPPVLSYYSKQSNNYCLDKNNIILDVYENIDNPGQCAVACNNDKNCISFNYNKSTKQCKLSANCYKDVNDVTINEDETNYGIYDNYLKDSVKGALPSITKYNKYDNKLCINKYYDILDNKNLEECSKLCENDENCMSFTHGSNNDCLLSTNCSNESSLNKNDNQQNVENFIVSDDMNYEDEILLNDNKYKLFVKKNLNEINLKNLKNPTDINELSKIALMRDTNECIDYNAIAVNGSPINLDKCYRYKLYNGLIYDDKKIKLIRDDKKCLNYDNNNKVVVNDCTNKSNIIFNNDTKQIKFDNTNMCLKNGDDKQLVINTCDKSDVKQKWFFI